MTNEGCVVFCGGGRVAQVRPLKQNEDPLNSTQIYTIIVSLATVIAWCCNSFLQVGRQHA